ncbi:MAG: methyltransferase domain-containing protein [Alphaproteobacteria bacterium]|nr:methyltransferase domain-containing protein [Alphaproteobacteria bacterium]
MALIDDQLEKAMDYYRDENLDEAKNIYDMILAQDPNNQEALDWRGEIAIQQDDYELAAKYLQRSKDLYPADFEENCKLGLAYYEISEAEHAVDTLFEAISIDGTDLVSHSNLGKALYDLYAAGMQEKAQKIASIWASNFPEQPDAAHMGAAVAGFPAPERANDAYVADVFNDFAPDFEQKLEELGYQAPELLRNLVEEIVEPAPKSQTILDAGCGTGLCAPLLSPWAEKLDGVDLSPGMLEKAEERDQYDSLVEEELVTYLRSYLRHYDLIVAADVFCYFGDLEEAFEAAAQSLKKDGYLTFSLECEDVINYALKPSGRYSHAHDYVINCLRKCGFDVTCVKQDILRWEYGQEVNGILVLAKKTS